MATPNTYKNGAVSVLHAFEIICRIIKKYGPKLQSFIDGLEASSKITTAQHDQVTAFLASATALCAIWAVIAAQQGA